METKTKAGRRGTVITLGQDIAARIPKCMDNVYRINEFAVDDADGDKLTNDETFRGYHITSHLVEGTSMVRNNTAVSINGLFEISLLPEDIEKENALDRTYPSMEEAVKVWKELETAQLDKAKALLDKVNHAINHLETALRDGQN